MSQTEIDSIIKKYDRSVPKPRYDVMHTERKKQARDPHLITFMDNNYTASKQKPNSNGQAEELLRQLDQAQSRLAISERNYAQISRKYDKLKQAYDLVSGDLQKQRKVRLQELLDTQNKLALLEQDNNKNLIKLESKDHTIAILKEKLEQKEEQIAIFQAELQNISRKLCETLELKDRQSKYINPDLEMTNQQAQKVLEGFRQKYEKIISNLNSDITNFNKDLLEKQKQKKKLIADIDQISKKHMKQIKELKDVVAKNEQQYKNWLDESKKEKIELIQKYEQQIKEARKSQFMEKLGKADNLIDETSRSKSFVKEMELKIVELQNEVKSLNIQLEKQTSSQKQNYMKNLSLQQELKHFKNQYFHQVNENKKFLANAKAEEERLEKLRAKYNKNEIQLGLARIKNEEGEAHIKQLKKQIENLKADMGKQLKSLINVKKELSQATNSQLNMNSMLTQASSKLQQKIKNLESELESSTRELYAQRLEKAKLAEELEETKVELKRQYELSLENTKRELQQQIKWSLHQKTDAQIDKQKLYLNMFKIERQYELLKSEVVTTEEMLRMGTKMGKYYQKRTK